MRDELKAIILDQTEKALYLLDEAIQRDEKLHIGAYQKQFISLLNFIKNMQAKQTIGDVGVIAFFMSRIQMDENCFFYKVMLYEDNLYMAGHKVDFRFDISNVFSHYQKELEALYDAPVSAFYKGRLPEIKAALSQYIPYFNMYAVNLLRAAAQDPEITGKLEEIKKREKLYIIQNEIYETPYLIYTTNPNREVTA